MKLLRWLLIPLVPIYDLVTRIRNHAYDKQWLKSTSFSIPIIGVGNLSVGGTGKTPMVEFLLQLLKDDLKVATLSRGYGRKSSGFLIANEQSDATTIGDEPMQFYSKYNNIMVAVDEQRVRGVRKLLNLTIPPDIIILDDAFQHRKVRAGYYILLTDYSNLYVDDFLLPTGNLREARDGAKRADIIVVTKCPSELSENEKQTIISKLNPQEHQQVFFSKISYSEKIVGPFESVDIGVLRNKKFTLLTGIANPKPLKQFLELQGFKFDHLEFKDHHNFSEKEIEELAKIDLVLTTEKDYVRLKSKLDNLYYLPITIEIDKMDLFTKAILDYSRTIL